MEDEVFKHINRVEIDLEEIRELPQNIYKSKII